MRPPKILLTGRPGLGKTTAIRRILANLPDISASGFYTQEIRGPEGRIGFRAVTLGGTHMVLAHVDRQSRFRVSRYGVDVAGFERIVVPSIDPRLRPGVHLLVIDEIGKMECASTEFQSAVRRALGSEIAVVGTIAMRGGQFIESIKSSPAVTVVELTRANRDTLPQQVADTINAYIGGKT